MARAFAVPPAAPRVACGDHAARCRRAPATRAGTAPPGPGPALRRPLRARARFRRAAGARAGTAGRLAGQSGQPALADRGAVEPDDPPRPPPGRHPPPPPSALVTGISDGGGNEPTDAPSGGASAPTGSTDASPGTEPTAAVTGKPWTGTERLNILFIGADRRPGEATFNTDTRAGART